MCQADSCRSVSATKFLHPIKKLEWGLDSYPIMRHRVNGNRVKTLSAVKIGDQPHETYDQDRCPDGRTSGHIHRSCRPTGSRRGRRPATSVPTKIKNMQNNSCSASRTQTGRNHKVTKVTCRNCNLGRSPGLAIFGLADQIIRAALIFCNGGER